MADYIRREDALFAIRKAERGGSMTALTRLERAYAEIREMPAADVAEVVLGQWEGEGEHRTKAGGCDSYDAGACEVHKGHFEIGCPTYNKDHRNVFYQRKDGYSKMDATSVKAQEITDRYALYNGDSCEILPGLPDNSIHFEIYSPPFASLYTYSNSERDLGNCKSDGEFFEHFSFIIKELYRVLMPGRIMAVHCMNLPTSKERDGYIGIKDFRGELIRAFQKSGFIYHSEVCIWKDPVIAMQRTKALGLLHKQLKKDSCMSRQGIPDYLVAMRKPGENPERVEHTNETFPVSIWQRYASPIWTDINPSDTLQATSCRDENDERHICPLQLTVIRRALNLWSNPGDTVLSPFMGIGSEGVVSLQNGRRFVGVELKPTWYEQSVKNCAAVTATEQQSLW